MRGGRGEDEEGRKGASWGEIRNIIGEGGENKEQGSHTRKKSGYLQQRNWEKNRKKDCKSRIGERRGRHVCR